MVGRRLKAHWKPPPTLRKSVVTESVAVNRVTADCDPVPRVDPRACGVAMTTRRIVSTSTGRSPRMRGRRDWDWDFLPPLRNILAYARQTLLLSMRSTLDRVHPNANGTALRLARYSEHG